MEIRTNPFYELRNRLYASAAAGCAIITEDFRLKRAVEAFKPMSEANKVFGKLYRMDSITSHTKDKDRVIKDFAEGRIRYLCASSILERGVTFSAIDVAVFRSDHPVFDYASLVQMTGRVGRDPKNPEGTGIFLCAKKSGEVDKCVSGIMTANRLAFGAENGLTTRKTS